LFLDGFKVGHIFDVFSVVGAPPRVRVFESVLRSLNLKLKRLAVDIEGFPEIWWGNLLIT
jgi:hypothetical protein